MPAKLIPNPDLWRQLAPTAGYHAEELARLLQISIRTLERQFKTVLDRTPQDWLNELRLERMMELLCEGYMAKQISSEVGIPHNSGASRMFKAQAQMTMTEFMAQLRKGTERPPAQE